MLLDVNFNFVEHINAKIKKANKVVSAMKKRHPALSPVSSSSIHKSFIWPNLDDEDVIYDALSDLVLFVRFGTNLKNVKNTHGEVIILVKLQALACDSTCFNLHLWLTHYFSFLRKDQICSIQSSVN